MAADPITWPVAVTIISGIAIAFVVVAGYIHQNFKKETPWKDPIDKLNTLVIKLESTLASLNSKIDDTNHALSDHEVRNDKDFDRVHERLEKVTDLMIDMLRVDNPPQSNDKSEKENE